MYIISKIQWANCCLLSLLIVGEELRSALLGIEQEGSLVCYTYCDTHLCCDIHLHIHV